MQISESWKRKLEEELREKLKSDNLSAEDLSKLRKDVEWLQSAGVSENIPKLLEERTRELNSRRVLAEEKTIISGKENGTRQGFGEQSTQKDYRTSWKKPVELEEDDRGFDKETETAEKIRNPVKESTSQENHREAKQEMARGNSTDSGKTTSLESYRDFWKESSVSKKSGRSEKETKVLGGYRQFENEMASTEDRNKTGIKMPAPIPDESEKKMADSEAKAGNMKKSPAFIIAIIAAASILVFVILFAVHSSQEKANRVPRRIAEAEKLVVAGDNQGALDELSKILREETIEEANRVQMRQLTAKMMENVVEKDGEEAGFEFARQLSKSISSATDYEKAKEITERLLEHIAREDGPDKAFERCAEIYSPTSTIIDRDRFYAFAEKQVKDEGESPIVRWEYLHLLAGQGKDVISAEEKKTLQDKSMDRLAREMENGAKRDVKDWIERQGNYGTECPADPDTALRFLYVLNRQGLDVYELFREGILVDIPMGDRVQNLKEKELEKASGSGSDASGEYEYPDISIFLPISIREKVDATGYEGNGETSSGEDTIYNINEESDALLEETIEGIQRNDAHYEVFLLTEFLFKMPKNMRPETFSECKALLCMQTVYIPAGSVFRQIKGTSLIREQYMFFAAWGGVTAYGLNGEGKNQALDSEVDLPQANNDEWLESQTDIRDVVTAGNMLGTFDRDKLKETYSKAIENAELLDWSFWIENEYKEIGGLDGILKAADEGESATQL